MDHTHHLLANPRTAWIIISSGLALLAIALLVLARLRWTQSRPISTCVGLSVFAHILLIVTAYMTNLFDAPRPPSAEEIVRLSIATTDQVVPDKKAVRDELQPWERLPTTTPRLPEPDALEPRDFDPPITETSPSVQRMPAVSQDLPTVIPSIERPWRPEAPESKRIPPDGLHTPVEPVDAMLSAHRAEAKVVAQPDRDELSSDEKHNSLEETESNRPEQESRTRAQVLPGNDGAKSSSFSDVIPAKEEPLPAVHRNKDVPREANTSIATAENTRPNGSPRTSQEFVQEDTDWTPSPPGRWPIDMDELQDARRLTNGEPLPPVFRLRVAPDRLRFVRRLGGNARSEKAVEDALRWLAANQNPDGRWDASATGGGRERQVAGQNRAHAGAQADTGITGLALLVFLGAGHTHLDGEYRQVVQHGLEYLLGSQQADGNMAGAARRYAQMYCHGIATLAISEAYAMTRDSRMDPFVRRAVNYTVYAQHAETGGWRYGPSEPGDTSQLGWQLMALCSAELGGIAIPERTRLGVHRFIRSVSSGRYGGLAAYRPAQRDRPTRPMTAEAMVCRLFLKESPKGAAFSEAAEFLLQEPPGHGQANLYYWYYATLGLCQLEAAQWKAWNDALLDTLLPAQRTEGHVAGSWDPDTIWGGHGGRVYSTALAALCLEVYYRYAQLPAVRSGD